MFELNPFKKKEQRETGKKGVEAEFVKRVRLAGGKAYKFTSEMNRGVTDRLVVFPGQVWFVEIKRDKGKMTELQIDFMQYIKSLGLNHFIVYGKDGIQEFLKEILNNDKSGKIGNI